jgi:hypothetical protein
MAKAYLLFKGFGDSLIGIDTLESLIEISFAFVALELV